MLRIFNFEGCYGFLGILGGFATILRDTTIFFTIFGQIFTILAILHKFATIFMSKTTIFNKKFKILLRFLTIKIRFLGKCTATDFFSKCWPVCIQ